MKVNLLVIRTLKLEEMRRFYSALGANFEKEKHANGPEHYAAVLSDNFVLELYPCINEAEPVSGLWLGFRVDDLEKILRSLGQSVKIRRVQQGLSAFVQDPEGRTVELLQADATCAA